MNEPSENPYASPTADCSTTVVSAGELRLLPLWVWLGFSVIGAFFGSPADPTSMLLALAYALLYFCVGAIAGSSLHSIIRALPVALSLVPLVTLAFLGAAEALFAAIFTIAMLCYGLVNIAFGFWACRSLGYGRFRILSCFCAGYALGSVACGLGTILGAVLGAVLAKRSLEKSASALESDQAEDEL